MPACVARCVSLNERVREVGPEKHDSWSMPFRKWTRKHDVEDGWGHGRSKFLRARTMPFLKEENECRGEVAKGQFCVGSGWAVKMNQRAEKEKEGEKKKTKKHNKRRCVKKISGIFKK